MHRSLATVTAVQALRIPPSRALKVITLAGMGAFLLGCPNPQTYGTPRTTPAGKIAHTVALEGIHLSTTTTTPATPATPSTPAVPAQDRTASVTVPMLPTYQLRVGLADRADLGVRITNLSALGADVKWNFYKSQGFDLAVAPNVQMNYFSASGSSIFILYGHLPLLAGINFGDSATLVLAGGLSLAYGSGTAAGSSDSEAARTVTGGNVGARGGLGLNLRVSKKFALHPEVTGIKFFNDASNLMIVFGLGFNFGHLPSYAPGSEDDAPEDAQPKKNPNAPPANAPATTPAVQGT